MLKNLLVLIGLVFAALAVYPAWADGGSAFTSAASPEAVSTAPCPSSPCREIAIHHPLDTCPRRRCVGPLTTIFHRQVHRSTAYHPCTPGDGRQLTIKGMPRSTASAGKELSHER